MTETGHVDPDLLATIRDLVAAHAPSPRDPDAGVALDESLWVQFESLGLARLTGSGHQGGSGATWHEAAALLTELASAAVTLPVGEHDLLAGWLLRQAGMPAGAERRTIALLGTDGLAPAVPWARHAASVVTLWSEEDAWHLADVPLPLFGITHDLNLAGEPRDALRIDRHSLIDGARALPATTVDELRLRSALVRAIQTSGALERCLALTLEHTTTRVQFSRPIARFQAVQHLLARIAAENALARAAVDAAVGAAAARDAGEADLEQLAFAVAVARSCTGHAASVVVRTAHQLLGAIGTTLEHALHRATLPALAWRSEYGSTQHWDEQVAALAHRAGAGLWALITR